MPPTFTDKDFPMNRYAPDARDHRDPSSGQVAAIIAALTTCAYAGMKVIMATRSERGLPGFPARPDAYADPADIARSEWMLVILGVVAASVAFTTLLSPIRRIPRWIVVATVLLAGGSQAMGAIGMTLRATRILPDLGAGPQGWSTWTVVLILDIGAIAWGVLAWTLIRHGHIANDPA